MKTIYKYIIAGILILSTTVFAAGKLQNSDFSTSAAITGAGGTIAQLLNTSKIYDSTNAQLLDTTIAAKLNTSAFTDAAVTGKLITGYVSGAGVVAATDSILQAIQKLNGNIAAIVPGSGDVVGPASSVNSEIALFDGATGKLLKSATGTGVCQVTSGVFSVGNVALASQVSGTLPVANATISTQAIGASAIDWSTGNAFTKTLAANTTFTFSNQTSGQTIVVRLTNTASNYTVTWPTVRWAGGAAPTMTIGAKSDVYTFVYDGSNTYGSYVQDMY